MLYALWHHVAKVINQSSLFVLFDGCALELGNRRQSYLVIFLDGVWILNASKISTESIVYFFQGQKQRILSHLRLQ